MSRELVMSHELVMSRELVMSHELVMSRELVMSHELVMSRELVMSCDTCTYSHRTPSVTHTQVEEEQVQQSPSTISSTP